MSRPTLLRVALPCALAFASACANPDFMGTPLTGQHDGGTNAPPSNGSPSPSSGDSCPYTKGQDPSSLPACCDGKGAAHCVPSAQLPAAITSQLDMCSGGGYCVPDSLIESGGARPPSCHSLNNADGVCMSICVPMVAQYQALLPQDTCADDERCAPCVNPLTNMPSGACDIGACANSSPDGGSTGGPPAPPACPHMGPPVIDPSTLPACGTDGGAHCLQTALVPAAMASQLATCPTGLCVPDVFIEAGGNFIPPTCASLDNAEGRCLNTAIPEVASQKSLLPQSTCQTYERCVPCYSPIDGSDTGACKLSCDPGPTQAKVVFQSCCEKNNNTYGKCVPQTAIPQSLQKNLSNDSCNNNGDLCVPTENLSASFTPPACTASNLLSGNYSGVCLSDCLDFGIQGLAISRGTCDDLHKCAPCKNPLTGQPTGAPGCPAT